MPSTKNLLCLKWIKCHIKYWQVWVWFVLSENWSLNRKEIIQNFVSFNRMQTAYYCWIKFVASWAHQISGLSPPCSYLKVSSKHTNCIFRTVYLAIKQRKDRVAGITSFFASKKIKNQMLVWGTKKKLLWIRCKFPSHFLWHISNR